jgi:hypothetical protein
MSARRLLDLLLALLALWLAVALVIDFDRPAPVVERAADPAADVRPPPPPSLDDFEVVLERPLFARDRRADMPAVEEPPREEPDWRLVGVVVAGEESLALLADPESGTTERVRVGDDVGEWRLTEVSAGAVVLRDAGGDERTLALRADAGGEASEPEGAPRAATAAAPPTRAAPARAVPAPPRALPDARPMADDFEEAYDGEEGGYEGFYD